MKNLSQLQFDFELDPSLSDMGSLAQESSFGWGWEQRGKPTGRFLHATGATLQPGGVVQPHKVAQTQSNYPGLSSGEHAYAAAELSDTSWVADSDGDEYLRRYDSNLSGQEMFQPSGGAWDTDEDDSLWDDDPDTIGELDHEPTLNRGQFPPPTGTRWVNATNVHEVKPLRNDISLDPNMKGVDDGIGSWRSPVGWEVTSGAIPMGDRRGASARDYGSHLVPPSMKGYYKAMGI